jgi:Rhs element Vgr protein
MAVLVDGSAIKDVYQVTRVQVTKAINRIPVAKVVILDGSAVEETFEISESNDFVPGKEIEIKAGYHGENTTIFKGIIVKHGIKVRNDRSSFLVLTCNDKAVKLTVARTSEQFVEKKDSDVIKGMLAKAGLEADVESTAKEHEQQIKHYASDWDYLVTRADVNGRIVIVDDGRVSVKTPEYKSPELVVRYGDTLTAIDAEIDARSQLPTVKSQAWDPADQKVESQESREPEVNKQGNLSGKKLVDVLELRSYELQSCTSIPKQNLTQWANAQMLKSRLARIQGNVTFPGSAKAKAGTLIELKGLGSRFNGDAFVSSVQHDIEAGEWTTEVGFGLSQRWFTEEREHIEAPAASGLLPGARGLQIATVKQIHDDPEGQRRIKVVMPMVASGGDGVWVRLASPYATSDAGMFFMPEVDDEVVLGFLNDDPVSAIVLGSLHSSARKAPYEPDDKNTNKAIVTNSQMKIWFDDTKKNLQIETPGGHVYTLSDENKSITIKDSNNNRIQMDSSGIRMESPGNVFVKAGGNIRIEGAGGISLESPADVGIKGLNTNVKAEAALSAEGQASAEVTSTGQTTVRGTMVMIN